MTEPIIDPTQTPPEPPAPDPPPDPPPAPADPLADLVDRLSKFDPAEVLSRLDALEHGGATDPGDAIRQALEPFLTDVKTTLHETADAIRSLITQQQPARKPKPEKDPPASADPDTEPAASTGGGLLSKLFDTPVIGPKPNG